MRPNPERRLAFSFRHADYLGCGLPILTGPDTALTDLLGDAGWVTELDGLSSTLHALLDDAEDRRSRSRAARALARGVLSPARAGAALVAWVAEGTRHPRAAGPLVDAARLASGPHQRPRRRGRDRAGFRRGGDQPQAGRSPR